MTDERPRITSSEMQRKAAAAGLPIMTEWNPVRALDVAREGMRRGAGSPYVEQIGRHSADIVEELTHHVDLAPTALSEAVLLISSMLASVAIQGAEPRDLINILSSAGVDLADLTQAQPETDRTDQP